MYLQHKPDFDQAREYWRAYWSGEIVDRPCVCLKVGGGRIPPPTSLNGFMDADRVAANFDDWASDVPWMAEAVPFLQPNFGPDQFAAWLGGELIHSEAKDTSWSKPIVRTWDQAHLESPIGIWWERALEFHRRIAEVSEGRFLIGMADIHSNMDALSALRGPQDLCADLLDVPDEIDSAMVSVRRSFAPVFEGLEAAGQMADRGYIGWLPFYSQERFAVLQCDFACMVGPSHFRRWILPALEEEASFLDHAVYHYDGPDALVHLKDVLSIRQIDAIQWVPGEGNPPVIEWMDLLVEIQKAGKGLYIGASPDEVKVYHKTLKPEGVLYDVSVSTPQEAEDLLAWLKANT